MADQTISDSDFRTFLRLTDIAGKYGGPEGLQGKISKLEEDAATFRTKSKELEGKVPKEGAVVLEGEDAKRWDAYQALGKAPDELAAGLVLTPDERKRWEVFNALEVKPEDIPALVEENKTLKAESEKRAWSDGVNALAKAERIPEDSVPALSAILRTLDPAAAVEVKKEKGKDASGADVENTVGYVTLAGKATKFSDLRSETPELKGIRTEVESGGGDTGNRHLEQVARGDPGGARTAEDHKKAVTSQLDYNV